MLCVRFLRIAAFGDFAGDAELGPLWAKAEALGVPIFIHPIGFTSPERMQKAMLWNSIGQPLEEALAMCSLIYGGVLDAYPKLKLAICHGGGYLPYYIGRHDWIYGYRSEVSDRIKKKPSAYLKRFYYDSVIFDHDQLETLKRKDEIVILREPIPKASLSLSTLMVFITVS